MERFNKREIYIKKDILTAKIMIALSFLFFLFYIDICINDLLNSLINVIFLGMCVSIIYISFKVHYLSRKRLKELYNVKSSILTEISYVENFFNNQKQKSWQEFLLKTNEINKYKDKVIQKYYDEKNENANMIDDILYELYRNKINENLKSNYNLSEEELIIILSHMIFFIDMCETVEDINEGFELYKKVEKYKNRMKNK